MFRSLTDRILLEYCVQQQKIPNESFNTYIRKRWPKNENIWPEKFKTDEIDTGTNFNHFVVIQKCLKS